MKILSVTVQMKAIPLASRILESDEKGANTGCT